jgi:ABC-type transporter Mla MlaB component
MADEKESPKTGLLSKVARFVANPTTHWEELDKRPAKVADDSKDQDRQALKALIELKRKNDFVRHREFSALRKLRQQSIGAQDQSDKLSERPSFFQSSFQTRPDDKLVTLKKINEIEAQMSMQWWSTKHAGNTINPSSTLNPLTLNPATTTNPASVSTEASALPSLPSQPHSQSFLSSFSASDKSDFQSSVPGFVTVTGNSALPIFESRRRGPDSKPGFVNTQNAAGGSNSFHSSGLTSTSFPHSKPVADWPVHAPVLPPVDDVAEDVEDATTPMPLQALMPSSPPAPQPVVPQDLAPVVSPSPISDERDFAPSSQSGFTSSKSSAMVVEEITHDPDLEEAAIRFANGDDVGAEGALQDALQSKESGEFNEQVWLALFDLYRATANQTAFESLSIDYAGYFHRSSPQWVDFPAQIQESRPVGDDTSLAPHWKAPVAVGIQSIATLRAALSKAVQPWRLDWSRLIRVDDAAVPLMIDLVREWCRNPNAQFRFAAPEALVELLAKATPPNQPAVPQNWWHLRLEFLRLFHRPDEFEIVALEFCITYEVSPPAWEPASCSCKLCDASGASQQGGLTIIQSGKTRYPAEFSNTIDGATTRLQELPINETTVELSGHLQGDPQEALQLLDEALEGADRMVISCGKLIRIDFLAAGSLLNWVNARHQEGRQVHFVEVHRMILAFFHVIGISEHALISVRTQ